MAEAKKKLEETVVEEVENTSVEDTNVEEANVVFEVKAQEDRRYKFSIPKSAPLFECFDATVVFMSNLIETTKQNMIKADEAAKAESENKTDESVKD